MTSPLERDGGFRAALQLIRASYVYAAFDRCRRFVFDSAQRSRTWAFVAPMAMAIAALPRRERLRVAATVSAAAALTHAAALGFVPVRIRPVVPRVFWVVVGIVAAVAAIRGAGGTSGDQTSDE